MYPPVSTCKLLILINSFGGLILIILSGFKWKFSCATQCPPLLMHGGFLYSLLRTMWLFKWKSLLWQDCHLFYKIQDPPNPRNYDPTNVVHKIHESTKIGPHETFLKSDFTVYTWLRYSLLLVAAARQDTKSVLSQCCTSPSKWHTNICTPLAMLSAQCRICHTRVVRTCRSTFLTVKKGTGRGYYRSVTKWVGRSGTV